MIIGTHFKDLLDEVPDDRKRQPSELILLQQFVQVDAEELKHEAEVISKLEAVQQSHDILAVVGVIPLVKLPPTGEGGRGNCGTGRPWCDKKYDVSNNTSVLAGPGKSPGQKMAGWRKQRTPETLKKEIKHMSTPLMTRLCVEL